MKTLVHCRTSCWASLLAVATLTGCSVFKSREVPLDSSAGLFDKAHLSYQVDTDRINTLPAARGDAQLVSYHESTAPRLPANAQASVDIRYPHPEKREGFAQVRVRIEGHASEKPAGASALTRWLVVTRNQVTGFAKAGSHEIWTLDIPKSEVAMIVSRLHTSGYFAGYEKAEGTEIETELDGSKISKSWHQIPEMDALVVRVRTEGRLVSSTKAPAKKAAPAKGEQDKEEKDEGLFASVALYRTFMANDKKADNGPEGFALATDLYETPYAAPPVHPLEIVRLPAVGNTVR